MKIFHRALMPSSAPMLSEHIPPELVDAVISNLCRAAGKAAFLGIALFEDGFGAAFAFGRFPGHACLTWAQATDHILDPNHYTDAASMSVYPQTQQPMQHDEGFLHLRLAASPSCRGGGCCHWFLLGSRPLLGN
jgi:hypothetical protein